MELFLIFVHLIPYLEFALVQKTEKEHTGC